MDRRDVASYGEDWSASALRLPLAEAEAHLTDPVLSRVLSIWCRAREEARADGRPLPDRRALDAHTLGSRVLPHIVLLDCVKTDGLPDCRYRLLGTALVEAVGMDATGKTIRAAVADPDYAEQLVRQAYCALRMQCPVFTSGHYRDAAGNIRGRRTKRLTLPTRTEGMPDGTLVAAQVFTDESAFPDPRAAEEATEYRNEAFLIFRDAMPT